MNLSWTNAQESQFVVFSNDFVHFKGVNLKNQFLINVKIKHKKLYEVK